MKYDPTTMELTHPYKYKGVQRKEVQRKEVRRKQGDLFKQEKRGRPAIENPLTPQERQARHKKKLAENGGKTFTVRVKNPTVVKNIEAYAEMHGLTPHVVLNQLLEETFGD